MADSKVTVGTVGLGGESVFLSVDHFHAPGETLQADSLFIEPGGKAYNQAVAAARLGAQVLFFGAVGQDGSGALCRDVLEKEGVLPILQILPDRHTAYASILTDRCGENRVTVSHGAADCLSPDFIYAHEPEIARCTHLILGLECPLDATCAALELARQHHVYTILNPAPALPLDAEFLRCFDLLTPNLQEASVLLGLDHQPRPGELAQQLRSAGLNRTVVTLGSRGSLLVTDQECLLFPAIPVTPADTTGAGDTFNAGLAVALGRGFSMTAAIEFATNASAFSVAGNHVIGSLPTEKQLADFWQPVKPTGDIL